MSKLYYPIIKATQDIDSVKENNERAIILSNADIEVRCDDSNESESGYYIYPVITNAGGKTANSIVVTACSILTANEVIDSKTIKSLSPGQSKTVKLFIPYKYINNIIIYYNTFDIKAFSSSEDSYYPDNTVKVILMSRHVDGLELSEKELTLLVGKSYRLNASVYPENAANKRLTYTSSNTKVATLDKNGVVKALLPGKGIITVTTADGNYQQKCTIKVIQR